LRDETRLDALALQDRVGHDRGRTEHFKGSRIDMTAELLQQLADPLDDGGGRIFWRAQNLVEVQVAAVVEKREVGERSTSIESELGHVTPKQVLPASQLAKIRNGPDAGQHK